MKTYFTSLLGIVAMSCLVATAASCSDHQKEPAPAIKSVEANPAPASNLVPERALPPTTTVASPVSANNTVTTAPTDIFSATSSALDGVTRDQVASLTALPDTLNRSLDAAISSWKAKGGNSTNIDESKLELARTDFTQKVRTLSLADEETWKSAKADARSSLENLRQVYGELLSRSGSGA